MDNNSTDGTEDFVREYAKRCSLNLRSCLEQLVAKRLTLNQHVDTIANGHQLKEEVWRHIRSEIGHRCGDMEIRPVFETRKFVLSVFQVFPELLFKKDLWKVLLKTVLSRQTIDLLKRLERNSRASRN